MNQLMGSRVRRALLPILVASLAVTVVPAVHIEASGPVRVAASELHGSLERERTFALPFAASHVALHWTGQAAAQVTVAFSSDGQTFGPAILVERDEIGEGRANGETYGNLLLAGGATFVRVSSDRPLAHLSVLDLDTRGSGQASIGFGAVAAATTAQPAVISRAGWGANESLRFDANGNELFPPVFQTIQKLIVHHTATQNNDPTPAATVRAIYYYDTVTQGWGDMGYNFLIDEQGTIYEGRCTGLYHLACDPTEEDALGKGVTGAHAIGFNSGTVGIALLGTLTHQDATPEARDALTRLLAWIAGGHGIDPHGSSLYVNPVSGTQATFANIAGHRDVAATECPGGVFYATLPALRDSVATLIAATPTAVPGAPTIGTATAGNAQATVSFSPPASDGGSPITSYTVTSTPGGLTASGPASPLMVTGLANGTAYTFTAHATNAAGNSPESPVSNSVTPTAALAITTTSLPSGRVNRPYTATVQATGGALPYTWTITSGFLPSGLTLGASTGTISGTPTRAVTYSFTVSVSDSSTAKLTASKALSITISRK
jgi:hypothetical protein